MYRIHPALPTYLAERWHAENPGGYDSERDAATRTLAAACANCLGLLPHLMV
jgi:hypothetical protein